MHNPATSRNSLCAVSMVAPGSVSRVVDASHSPSTSAAGMLRIHGMTGKRPNQKYGGDHEKAGGDSILKERHVIAARQHQGPPVIRLHHEAEHHAEHHRQERDFEMPHRVAEDTEPERDADVEEAVLD